MPFQNPVEVPVANNQLKQPRELEVGISKRLPIEHIWMRFRLSAHLPNDHECLGSGHPDRAASQASQRSYCSVRPGMRRRPHFTRINSKRLDLALKIRGNFDIMCRLESAPQP